MLWLLICKIKRMFPGENFYFNGPKGMVPDGEVDLYRYSALLGRDATLIKIIKRVRIRVVIFHL